MNRLNKEEINDKNTKKLVKTVIGVNNLLLFLFVIITFLTATFKIDFSFGLFSIIYIMMTEGACLYMIYGISVLIYERDDE